MGLGGRMANLNGNRQSARRNASGEDYRQGAKDAKEMLEFFASFTLLRK
jgi:hypothetical protein